MAYTGPSPTTVANGGTNATSFGTTHGIVAYDGTRLANYAGPQLSTGGVMTNSSQPAFFAFLTSGNNVTNATGDTTNFKLGTTNALTKKFDQGTNFNTNGTFTAPVAGIYCFGCAVGISNIAAGHTDYEVFITASGVNYNGQALNPFACQSGLFSDIAQGVTCFVSMAANDTAAAFVTVGNSTKTITILGSTAPSTYFYGFLVC